MILRLKPVATVVNKLAMESKNVEEKPFFSLPREIRDQIYKLCLLSSETLQPLYAWSRMNKGFAIKLLRTSKTVHAEACSVFYGQNRFDFSDSFYFINVMDFTNFALAKEVGSFLEKIGSSAEYLGNAVIAFPQYARIELGNTALAPQNMAIIASLRRRCPNLRNLLTDLASTFINLEHQLLGRERPLRHEALALVDAHFRSIPSLQHIIVQVHEVHLSDDKFREDIERLGWTLSAEEIRERTKKNITMRIY
ncbi:hypothetical protein PG994_009685 [Apiospora phragmitis]|uniref:F-box domain-containing protein n=1 Tax=Apiospora phragmitis TaxID=2905665 RepID=A0ABR1U9I0_9PEZI